MTVPVTAAPPYPGELERDVTLGDGARIHIRPIRAADAEALIALHGRLNRRAVHHRFSTMLRRLPPDWARHLATVDYRRRLALVAEDVSGGSSVIVAVARYEPTSRDDTVDVAVVVQEGWQNRGLGTHLFRALLAAAEARGVHSFEALVPSGNQRMLDLIARCGTVEHRTVSADVTEVTFRRS